jgi:Tfp pilus assembly protein PilF/SAM-dependent methyltransferase
MGMRDLPELLQRAVDIHAKGRFAEAEALYLQLLHAQPEHFDALHMLGVLRYQQGHPAEALASFDKALEMAPDYVDALNGRGIALAQLNRPLEALASFDKALAIAPSHAEAHNNRGITLRRLKRAAEALESFDKAVAVKPTYAEAFSNRGNALTDLRRLEEALASYDKAILLKPDYAEAFANRGRVLAKLNRPSEALTNFDKALAIRPNDPDTLVSRGSALVEFGRLDEAISQFRRALAITPDDVGARTNLGLVLAEQGRLLEALAEAEVAAKLTDRPSFPHYELGVLFANCGRREAARERLHMALRESPSEQQRIQILLAALGFEPLPERAPPDLIAEIYRERAGSWGRNTQTETYRGAKLTAAALEKLVGASRELDILDAGCGTGLVGVLIRPRARRLDGVDISPEMIERAKETGIYDRLDCCDLVEFLRGRGRAYDVVTSAATLIHFADLRAVFEGAWTVLRDRGLFVFTLFPNTHDEDAVAFGSLDGLAQGGCFVHGQSYVAHTAEAAYFDVAMLESAIHEYYRGKPRMGLVVALRRRMRPDQEAACIPK